MLSHIKLAGHRSSGGRRQPRRELSFPPFARLVGSRCMYLCSMRRPWTTHIATCASRSLGAGLCRHRKRDTVAAVQSRARGMDAFRPSLLAFLFKVLGDCPVGRIREIRVVSSRREKGGGGELSNDVTCVLHSRHVVAALASQSSCNSGSSNSSK